MTSCPSRSRRRTVDRRYSSLSSMTMTDRPEDGVDALRRMMFPLADQGQLQHERRTLTHSSFDLDVAAEVVLDRLSDDREAEPRAAAIRLGREQRLEDAR